MLQPQHFSAIDSLGFIFKQSYMDRFNFLYFLFCTHFPLKTSTYSDTTFLLVFQYAQAEVFISLFFFLVELEFIVYLFYLVLDRQK